MDGRKPIATRRRLGPGAPAINNWVTLACTVTATVIGVLTFVGGLDDGRVPTPTPDTSATVLGVATADLSNRPNFLGESPLGDVIADAQLWFTQAAGAQIALVNPGGIRGPILYGATSQGEAPGQVTMAEALSVQPFRDRPLVTVTLTGAQLDQVLEQQFAGQDGQTQTQILQVSQGLSYRMSPTAAAGERVSQLVLFNEPIRSSSDYRVTVNAFLAGGGDGFSIFTRGRAPTLARGGDYDALAEYLRRGEPVAPGPADRIRLASSA
jgi:5'-nucleotidase